MSDEIREHDDMDFTDPRTPDGAIEVPVLVVGAGPAGLVTAIGLARHGVRSLVVERHPSTSIFPKATGVSLRSMEIFRGWGIDDAIRHGGRNLRPLAATVSRLDDRAPVESPLGFPDRATSAAVSPAVAAVSPQDHLEPVLVEHYRWLGRGEIRFSTELVSFDQDRAGVTAVIRDIASGETATVRSRYLVGADGHRSSVRTALGIAMTGPADLGQFLSILFRADLTEVLGETVYGLYLLEGEGPPRVVVPTGVDDRFVLGVPMPPGMDAAGIRASFPPERCLALVREAAGRPELDLEILATGSFAFSAQVAERVRVDRAVLVGDAAHRMTPRGGRGMNTAIADAYDLGWKLAWVCRGMADPSLVESHEVERGPIGRRNVALSMAPGDAGSADGLVEDLGSVYASRWIVEEDDRPEGSTIREAATGAEGPPFVPDARPGARAPHAWLAIGDDRLSTLDLFGRELILLTAADERAWRDAAADVAIEAAVPLGVRSVGRLLRDADGTFASAYGLGAGGAVLVRPDGVVAWRCRTAPADRRGALRAAIATMLGRTVGLHPRATRHGVAAAGRRRRPASTTPPLALEVATATPEAA
jgi:putative polyketide hydroxylase